LLRSFGGVPDLPRSHLVAYVLAGLLLVFAGARWVHASNAPATATAAASHGQGGRGAVRLEPRDTSAVVHVAGEVRRPGLYRLAGGARVADAVHRAGGPTRRADPNALNLAAKVEDGRQIVVPRRVPAAGVAAGTAAPSPAAAGGAPAAPVDLNTATLEELGTLDGVGPATAQKIIDYRTEHGGFRTVDELDQVPGIGEKRMAALREHVRV
jgi:competence protein ComEA